MILLLLFALFTASGQQQLSTNLSEPVQYRINASSDCFWCDENEACLPYDWYFPGCGLPEVKYSSCWVNWSAVAIVLAILAGILIVLIMVCVCYCCCKMRAAGRRRRQKAGERKEKKIEASRTALETMQADRREKREKEMDEYRLKYGIPKKSIQ